MHGKALAQDELDPEAAALIRRVGRTLDVGLQIGDVLFVRDESNAVERVGRDLGDLFEHAFDHLRWDVFRVLEKETN